MKKHNIITILTLFICSNLFAQGKDTLTITPCISSPNGNYIFLNLKEGDNKSDSILYANTDYFIIERTTIESLENIVEVKTKKIGVAKCVQSISELHNRLTIENIEQLKKGLNLKTDEELLTYFKQHKSPRDFGIFSISLEVKMAMGLVYLDKDVNNSVTYYYNLKRVVIDKSEKKWKIGIVKSGVGNYLLPYFKPMISKISTFDSLVFLTWKMPVSAGYIASIPKPDSSTFKSKSNLGRDMLTNLPPSTFRAKLFIQTADGWQTKETLMGAMNNTNDTLSFSFVKRTIPEEFVGAYLKIEDMVYNQGLESDTAFAYAIEKKSLPLLMGIKVDDIADGIKISWKQLPAKPYINGVEILRYNSQDELDTIAVLNALDTVFYDYEIKVGQTYRYQAKALYIPQLKLTQEVPAQGIGQYTKFSIPQPADHLKAVNEGKNVRLNWNFKDHQSFYAFYIYRGTSPDNISLIAGPIKTKTFLDTAGALSGRSYYTYGVITQNLRQDTSIFSNLITINPNRKIATTVPNDLSFYYSNGHLRISWKDVRESDNAIESYIVQKGIKGSDKFTSLSASPLTVNTITDSAIEAGITYAYKVACITFKGDTSEFGDASQYLLAKQDVELINTFYIRNLKDGVEVSLPAMQYDNRKSYNIYRREARTPSFTKIGSMPANTFIYDDKTTKANLVYVYAITITEKDDREGIIGKSISIRKD